MKKLLPLVLLLVLALCACGGSDADSAEAELLSGTHHAEIEVQDYGTIALELDADTAPISVTNFLSLAESGLHSLISFASHSASSHVHSTRTRRLMRPYSEKTSLSSGHLFA